MTRRRHALRTGLAEGRAGERSVDTFNNLRACFSLSRFSGSRPRSFVFESSTARHG